MSTEDTRAPDPGHPPDADADPDPDNQAGHESGGAGTDGPGRPPSADPGPPPTTDPGPPPTTDPGPPPTTDPGPPPLDRGEDDLRVALAAHPFTADFDAAHLERLSSLLGMVEVDAGDFVFLHGQPAETLYLVTEGTVALEIAGAARSPLVLETLHPGDALGWSWLYPPHRWHLDARVVTPMTALTLDAPRLRRLFADDPVLAAVVTWRIGAVLVDRLHHARNQLASVQWP